jgi:hypothetical protein
MLPNNLTHIKDRLQATAAMAVWCLAGIVAGLAALCWLSAAFFIWLLNNYTPLAACAIMGAIWAALAGILVLAGWLIRRAKRQKLAAMAARQRAKPPASWMNPSTVAAGLDIAQLVGGRRASALVVGAFAVVWLLGRLGQPGATTAAPNDDAS